MLILGGIGFPFPEDATLCLMRISYFCKSDKTCCRRCWLFMQDCLLADFFIFLAGNKYGRAVVNHPLFRKLISSQSLEALERQFARRGVLFILVRQTFVWSESPDISDCRRNENVTSEVPGCRCMFGCHNDDSVDRGRLCRGIQPGDYQEEYGRMGTRCSSAAGCFAGPVSSLQVFQEKQEVNAKTMIKE